MRYVMERYSIAVPFPGEYDYATIGHNGTIWAGEISAWYVGDQRWYFGNGRYFESACRFKNIYLPADSVIISATLLFSANAYIDTLVNSKITIQDSVTAASFSPGTAAAIYADFVGRARLATEVTWDGITNFGTAYKLETPDFSSLLQGLVDSYSGINLGKIVIFWGDREGRTPVPPALKANMISATGYDGHAFKLRVEFDSAEVIPEPHPSIFYSLKNISDAKYKLDDKDIINDARVLIPHAGERLDYSVDPPVWVPVDSTFLRRDQTSIDEHGRRTKTLHWAGSNSLFTQASWCEKIIRDKKDPTPEMTAKMIPATDVEIAKHLKTRVSDKFLFDNDSMGMLNKFWIDSKVMTIQGSYVTIDYGLTEITSLENIPGLFEVDVDRVDDVEELVG